MTNRVRPRIAPFKRPRSLVYVSAGSDQLFVGTGFFFRRGADERELLDSRHVIWVERCKYDRGTFF